jgi:hypothetical protein
VSVTRKTVWAGSVSDRVAEGPFTLIAEGAEAPGLVPAAEELAS